MILKHHVYDKYSLLDTNITSTLYNRYMSPNENDNMKDMLINARLGM